MTTYSLRAAISAILLFGCAQGEPCKRHDDCSKDRPVAEESLPCCCGGVLVETLPSETFWKAEASAMTDSEFACSLLYYTCSGKNGEESIQEVVECDD